MDVSQVMEIFHPMNYSSKQEVHSTVLIVSPERGSSQYIVKGSSATQF